jgi:hypothetical protein
MRAIRSAFLGILGGPKEGLGTLKLPGMSMSSSYGPRRLLALYNTDRFSRPEYRFEI